MALNYKQVSIPLVNGVDTKTDSKLNNAPLEVINAFVERDGVLRKKFGDVQLNKDVRTDGTPYSIASGVNVASYLDDILISTSEGFYAYLDSSEEWQKNTGNRICSVTDEKLFSASRVLNGSSVSYYNNAEKVSFYAENDKYAVVSEPVNSDRVTTEFRSYVLDKDSRNQLDLIDSVGGNPSVISAPVTNGTLLSLITKNAGSAPDIDLNLHPVLNGKFEPSVIIGKCDTTGANEKCFSYRSVSDGFYIVYDDATSGKYLIKKVSYSGSTIYSRELDNYPSSVSNGSSTVAINPNGTVEVVTLSEGEDGLEYYNLSLDLSTENSHTTESIGTSSGIVYNVLMSGDCTADGFYLFFSTSNPLSDYSSIVYHSSNGDDSLLFTTRFERGDNVETDFIFQSQAIREGEDVFIHGIISNVTTIGERVVRNFVMNQNFEILSIVSELNAVYFDRYQTLPELYLTDKTIKVPYNDNDEISLISIEVDSINSLPIQFQDTLIYPSGIPVIYDGQSFFGAVFVSEPVISVSNDGAGSISGDYLYKAVYKYTDNSGNQYRSGTSSDFELTSSSNTISIEVSPMFISNRVGSDAKNGLYSIEVYQANVSDGLYRIITEIGIGGGTGNFAGEVVSTSISIAPDIGLNQFFLYTTGDVVAEIENATPPALSDVVWHNGRIFGISARFNELRYSKIYVRGEGIAFADEFSIPVEDNQGRRSERATALASLDSRLIIFKPNSILVISGDGPDNAGQNNDFTEPELVTTDVGCNNPKSIVLTGDGVFFQSKKGIYLLDRSLSVSYVGAGIEQFKDDVINSALLMEERELLKFTTNEGRVLLYNHFYKQWTWYDDHENAVSAVNWKGNYGYIDNTGSVFIEDQTTHRKNGEFTKRTYDTGWLKLTGIQNYQRVRKLLISGEYKDAHQLKVTLSYDYDDSTEEDYILSPQSGEDYQYSIHLRRQKSQSIRIQIEDVDTGATDEGFKITDITLEAGIKKGLNKFTSDRSY